MKSSTKVILVVVMFASATVIFTSLGDAARADSSEQREMQEELRRSRVALESIAHSLENCRK